MVSGAGKGRDERRIQTVGHMEIYGQTDFCPVLDMAIRRHYERISEDSVIWKLK